MLETVIILSILLVILLIALRNLLIKVEKYEDVVVDQTTYLQNVSNIIKDSSEYLKKLDEKGIFQADDEVGHFFNQMKLVQEELDKYMLPENYGKKEKSS